MEKEQGESVARGELNPTYTISNWKPLVFEEKAIDDFSNRLKGINKATALLSKIRLGLELELENYSWED